MSGYEFKFQTAAPGSTIEDGSGTVWEKQSHADEWSIRDQEASEGDYTLWTRDQIERLYGITACKLLAPVDTLPNILDGTEAFLTAAGHPIPDVPAIPPATVIALRLKLLIEEVQELVEAVGFRDLYDYLDCSATDDETVIDAISRVDLVEMVDAFHDITVIAYGGALETAGREGAKRTADEVTRSNLAKIVDGKVLRREDGKISKPPNWSPPDIAGALAAFGWDDGSTAHTAKVAQ